jgi:hypothetical protein
MVEISIMGEKPQVMQKIEVDRTQFDQGLWFRGQCERDLKAYF